MPNHRRAKALCLIKRHSVKYVIANAASGINLFLPRMAFSLGDRRKAELAFKIHANSIANHIRGHTRAGAFLHVLFKPFRFCAALRCIKPDRLCVKIMPRLFARLCITRRSRLPRPKPPHPAKLLQKGKEEGEEVFILGI